MKRTNDSQQIFPIFKTPEEMSRLCGIGVNKLRQLMDERKIEFLQNSSHRLLTESAIIEYYHRYKTPALINHTSENL